MATGHSLGHLEKPKYITVHLSSKFFFVKVSLFEDIKEKSDISFGSWNKNKPLTNNSCLERDLGVVILLMKRASTVIIKTNITPMFILILFFI